jgi:oligopeptide/dipeptide ABC transporter ATP-binding protein
MYAGRIVEQCSVTELFESPQHPYSRALLDTRPRRGLERASQLPTIPGAPPTFDAMPGGCPFHPRCSRSEQDCRDSRPELAWSSDHAVACHHPMARPLPAMESR